MAPRKGCGHRKEIERDYAASSTFAEKIDGSPLITVFEAAFEPITNLTISPRNGKPIRVHDTHGRTDEAAFEAIEADLRSLGIYPDQ